MSVKLTSPAVVRANRLFVRGSALKNCGVTTISCKSIECQNHCSHKNGIKLTHANENDIIDMVLAHKVRYCN